MTGRTSRGLIGCAIATAFALLPAAAGAATITPNITTDEDTANSDCSLREAITLANGDLGGSYKGCAAVDDDPDTIVLQAGATYELSLPDPGVNDSANLAGDLDVRDEELTIESSGATRATIDGGDDPTNIGRVLELGPSGAFAPAVTLNRLIITKGDQDQGGGLWASSVGSVTINESSITDNDGSAGAGMRVNTPMTINDSTISGNSSLGDGLGAGIWVEGGNLALNRSSVSGNVTGGMAGGLAVQFGTATVTNSTIANNFAASHGGNIWMFHTALNLRSSTIANGTADSDNTAPAGDGGGIFIQAGTATASNTVIANNVDVSTVGNEDCSGTLTSEGHNLIEDTTGCTIMGSGTGDILGTDPQLGAFGDNGGPVPTYAFGATSPLTNNGNPDTPGNPPPACPTTDARGFPRSSAISRCDIGAYERQPPSIDPIADRTVQAGETLAFTATATPAVGGDTLSFSSIELPPGATLSTAGEFAWTPTEADIGTYPDITISVTDTSLAGHEDLTITVTAIPPPPGGGPGTTPPTTKKCKKGRKLKKVKGKKKCVKKKRKKRK